VDRWGWLAAGLWCWPQCVADIDAVMLAETRGYAMVVATLVLSEGRSSSSASRFGGFFMASSRAAPVKTILAKNPQRSVIAVAVLALTIQYAPALLLPGIDHDALRFVGKLTLAALGVVAVWVLGWWKDVGFVAVPSGKVRYYIPLLLVVALAALSSDMYVSSATQLAFFAFFAAAVGVAEEILVRGLFLQALLPKGVAYSVAVSSLLFGIMHFANLLTGANFGATLAQVFSAALIGPLFASLRLVARSIWPLMLAHALVDFFPMLNASRSASNEPLQGAIALIAVTIPFTLYGLWLLRYFTLRAATLSP
jgi:membrane protease YdiL (CAAX protease family)